MSREGTIASSLILTGLAVGLGFSAYYLPKCIEAKDLYYEQFVNKPETQAAIAYDSTSEKLLEAADHMGLYSMSDDGVLVVKEPDKESLSNDLDKAIEEISKSDEPKQYLDQILNINKYFYLDANKENAPVLHNLKIETKKLAYKFGELAIEKDPYFESAYAVYGSYKARLGGCIFGIVASSLGVIGVGIWAGNEIKDSAEDYRYYHQPRRRNKP